MGNLLNPTTSLLADVFYWVGETAFAEGDTSESCLWPPGSDEREAWEAGWRSARANSTPLPYEVRSYAEPLRQAG
jgi:hypothetical protein